ncbi:MAG: hypothetical protein IJE16_00210 [Ruminococcus sp.]|nr:hypothetical protein [Ruminococcus sp.]
MTFTELFKTYGVLFVFAIIVLIIIICIICFKRNKRIHKSNVYFTSFGGQAYQDSILNSLPHEDRLDYTHLYNKIDRIQNIVNDNQIVLGKQKSEAIDSLQTKVLDSQIYIDNYWRRLKQRKDFYHCIGLHYASFTLANKIKREQECIRATFVTLKRECYDLSIKIDELSREIKVAQGKRRYELMQEHKRLCVQHQRASKLKGIFGSRNTQFLNMVKAQNKKTGNYRDYIIKNFGIKGKNWGEKLRKRKLDQIK